MTSEKGLFGLMSSLPLHPPPDSVHRCVVTRVEAYGTFVRFDSFRLHSLVHKSEGGEGKSVGEEVWVKVIKVEKERNERGLERTRVSGSISQVSQVDGSDLGPSGGTRTGGLLGADPLLDMKSGVVIKGIGGTSDRFKGYDLVDDDADDGGESDDNGGAAKNGSGARPADEREKSARCMGRGRGTTLPAWMTQPKEVGAAVGKDAKAAAKEEKKARKRERKEKKKMERKEKKK